MLCAIYCDESGTTVSDWCYTIGALSVPQACYPKFERCLNNLIATHGIVGEVKWKKVGTSHGLINFGLDLLRLILNGSYCFSAIVVKKSTYRKWAANQETAFYTTYTLLLEHCAKAHAATLNVAIDWRSNTYAKQNEVVQVIGNHKLKKFGRNGALRKVQMADSRSQVALQAVDFLTGAINAAHNVYLKPDVQIAPGKLLCISKLAAILGWKDLIYDTYPNRDFNVWHFPIDFRCDPQTLTVMPNFSVPYVNARDIRLCYQKDLPRIAGMK